MADTTPLLASLLMGQRQDDYNPFATQRKYGRQLIVQGSSTAPLQSGNPLEGLARALQAGVGGYFAGQADRDERAQQQGNIDIYSQAAAERDPQKAAELLKGLKGGGAQQEALFGQIIQNNINEGLKQQQARGTLGTGGYGIGPGNGGTSITVTPGRQQAPGAVPQPPANSAGLDNNVMNIRQSAAPFEDKGQPQNGFETFNTPQAGANAAAANFAAYVKENPNITVAQAIAKWAPPTDNNNTQGYISRVSEQTGINPGSRLADVLANPVNTARLLEAGTGVEKGRMPAGVTPDVLVNAGQRVAGGAPQPAPGPPGVQVAQAGPAQPQMPKTSPGGDMLRAQAQQAYDNKDYKTALALAQKAQEADVSFMDKAGLQFQQQGLQQPNQTISNEAKMRDDFRQEPVVKSYREVVPIMESVREAVNRPTRAADLNLIYGLGKMMDPNSVVREGEMVMARGTGTVQDYISGLLGQLNASPTLLPDTRRKIVEEMQSRFQGLQQSHDTVAEVYKGIAQRSGLNHENIVIPIRQGKPVQQQEAAPAKAGPTRIDLNGNPL